MACKYCYIPFVGGDVQESVCRRIVQRVAELGFTTITFGGGDPLLYPWTPALVKFAKELGLFVHIDTNAIRLNDDSVKRSMLREDIDLLGIPIDGPTATIHNRMRSSRGHFQILERRLEWITEFRSKLKVNTVVSQMNHASIIMMVDLIANIKPSRWSLYQYWPLSLGAYAAADHTLTDELFSSATNDLAKRLPQITVETNSARSRKLTYPFVSHTGDLYLHDVADNSNYTVLGSIFDDSAVLCGLTACSGERPNARNRYLE